MKIMELIDKAAVISEIDNLKHKIDECGSYGHGWKDAFRMLEAELDSLEVKDVDLEKGMEVKKELSYEDYIRFFEKHPNFPDNWGFDEAWVFAKYFFEFGLKIQKGE